MSETTSSLSPRRSPFAFFAVAALSMISAVPGVADEFVGEFEGDGLHLELELDDGVYMGAITMGEQVFLCQARLTGPGIAGSFESDGGEYPFEVRPTTAGLVLSSGGAQYNLRRIGAPEAGDGTYQLGGGRAVGGGAGWGGDTGTGGVEEQGNWKTENRIVYVQSPGTGQWQPYARYYVEPQKLMFTFGDGSRLIYYRVQ